MRRSAYVLIALAGAGLLLFTQFPGLLTDLRGSATPERKNALFTASFADAGGHIQPVAQWRGKIVVVNFWASWCPPCREEMPELSALQVKYREQDVVVVGLSSDAAAVMQQFAQSNPVSYPLLAGDFNAMHIAASLGNDKGILPYTVILRRDGSIAGSMAGRLDIRAVEQQLAPLLKH